MTTVKSDDFAFFVEGGQELRVVEFAMTSEMSAPFSLDLVVHLRDAEAELAPEDLLGMRATLRIATMAEPAVRSVHGVVLEAEEIGESRQGVIYTLRVGPPLERGRFRSTSRVFVEKTTRQIVDSVLTRDPHLVPGAAGGTGDLQLADAFAPANELFEWRVQDTTRIDDVAARPLCVQYQETDLAFVSRLLEEEGIAYHFEHGRDAVVLVFSDADTGRTGLDPFKPLGPAIAGRELGALSLGGRMRPTKVQLTGFNWQKPRQDMTATAAGDGEELAIVAHPGTYPDAAEQGKPLAKAILERLQTEARYATAQGACRLLDAGTVFPLEHEADRYRGEYLVTRAVTKGRALGELPPGFVARPFPGEGAFHTHVECARRGRGGSAEETRFRPPRRVPKPRIQGSQTAIVTDDPDARGAEIHVGGPPGNENGCVRLRFHWDVETERHAKEPTSTWVRVSQALAGAGGGSVWHPRVGTEVIVDFLDGDPDRPIVVGRVYNGEQPPAALGKGAATVSTFKSLASPGGKVFNELAFDDTAGKEQLKLHAGKDWNSEVGNDRSESVGNNSHSAVNVNRNEGTGADRLTNVSGNNVEGVGGNESISVGGNQNLAIGGSQAHSVSGTRDLSVGGAHTVTTGPETKTVNGPQDISITAVKTEAIAAVYNLSVGALMTVDVGAALSVTAGASYTLSTPVATVVAPGYSVSCSSGVIHGADLQIVSDGPVLVQGGGDVTVTAGGTLTLSGASVLIKGGSVAIEGGAVTITGGSVDIAGGTVNVN
jgi:type VI secretion system secreted protein VgrG